MAAGWLLQADAVDVSRDCWLGTLQGRQAATPCFGSWLRSSAGASLRLSAADACKGFCLGLRGVSLGLLLRPFAVGCCSGDSKQTIAQGRCCRGLQALLAWAVAGELCGESFLRSDSGDRRGLQKLKPWRQLDAHCSSTVAAAQCSLQLKGALPGRVPAVLVKRIRACGRPGRSG